MQRRVKSLICMALAAMLFCPAGLSEAVWQLGLFVPTLSDAICAREAAGGQRFAAQRADVEAQVFETNGNEETELSMVMDFLDRFGDRAIVVADAASDESTIELAIACEEAGRPLALVRRRDEFLEPAQWAAVVCHLAADEKQMGYESGRALFDAMGGAGVACAIYADTERTDVSPWRQIGYQLAVYDSAWISNQEIETAATRDEARRIVSAWLSGGVPVSGIWAADDVLALGALDALNEAGRAGQVRVVSVGGSDEAIAAIGEGRLSATVGWDAPAMMALACALAVDAAQTGLSPENPVIRTRPVVITPENRADPWTNVETLDASEIILSAWPSFEALDEAD